MQELFLLMIKIIVAPKEKDSCKVHCQKLMEMKSLFLLEKLCMMCQLCSNIPDVSQQPHCWFASENALNAEKEMIQPSLLR